VRWFWAQIRPEYISGGHAPAAQFTDAEGVVALGEPTALLVDNQVAMEPVWVAVAEGAIEEDLPGCGFQQVGAADYLCNAHGEVVGYAGELVAGATTTPGMWIRLWRPRISTPRTWGRSWGPLASTPRTWTRPWGPRAFSAPDEEVTEINSGDEALWAEVRVVEFDEFAIGDAEAPVEAAGSVGELGGEREIEDAIPSAGRSAGARIYRLILQLVAPDAWIAGVFVGSAECGGEVLAGAAAWVDESALA